jgi:L-gulonate 5-dehydrogenase
MGTVQVVAVWSSPGRVELVERPVPVPGAGCVLLEIRAAGICGTDLHIISGHHPIARPPLVPGHEFCGVIRAVGPGVDPSLVGTRAGADSYRGCGQCAYCLSGRAQLCSRGTLEHGINLDGGWAEYIEVPAMNTYPLPDGVSFAEAGAGCILNCPMAAVEKVGIFPADDVLILGDGPSALIMVQLARLKGARTIVVSGHRARRLSLARELGADHAVNTNVDDLEQALKSLRVTPAVVMDAVGTAETFSIALRAAGSEGRIHLFGLPAKPFDGVPMDMLLFKELRIVSSTGAPAYWSAAMRLIGHGLLKVKPLITHRFALTGAPEALATLRRDREDVVKAVFEMGEGR